MTPREVNGLPHAWTTGQSSNRLAQLLDLAPTPLIEVRENPEGGREITYFNRAAVQTYGYDVEEALGRDPSMLSALTAPERERIQDALIHDSRWQGTGRHRTKDGREIDVEMHVSQRRDEAGNVETYLLAVEDVTEKVRRLRRLEEQAALLDLAPDPIFARDIQRRITFWNRAAETTYGYAGEEVMGRNPQDVLHTEYPIPLEEIERTVEATGRWEGDLVQTAKDGRRFVVASNWGALYGEDGRMVGLLEINRDATERVLLDEARARASAEAERTRLSQRTLRAQRLESLGQLAGGIAHDFNNLLAVIAGYASVLTCALEDLEDELPPTTISDLLRDMGEIAGATRRASDLTHQLLAFASQESMRAETLSLNEVIDDLSPLLARTIGEHVRLETRLDPGLDPIRADEGQLGQVLVNLAVNARDAMPGGGRLTIETANIELDDDAAREQGDLQPGRYVQLLVSDTGTGMPPDVVERAFDPFFTTKGPGEGTGLGLSSVYGIVALAGGRASLYSEPGRGTTFRAIFPAAELTAPGPSRRESTQVPQISTRRTVLVVEDEPALRAVTTRILERAGYHVLSAPSGTEALELEQATTERIDVLLTDVIMPEMLGPQLAALLKDRRPDIRVIFASGFARSALEHDEHELEGPVLQKPVSASELLSEIARSLEE
jgi:PAS domain S-box-containing protein